MKLPENVVKVNKIAFQNVVRQRLSFHYSEMEEHLEQFIKGIVEAGYQLKGPFFYSLNNVPLNEVIEIELFMPISNDVFSLKGYNFSTYFEISNLLKTIIKGDLKTLTEIEYAKLIIALEESGLEMVTPFYHVVPKNGLEYLELLVGYSENI